MEKNWGGGFCREGSLAFRNYGNRQVSDGGPLTRFPQPRSSGPRWSGALWEASASPFPGCPLARPAPACPPALQHLHLLPQEAGTWGPWGGAWKGRGGLGEWISAPGIHDFCQSQEPWCCGHGGAGVPGWPVVAALCGTRAGRAPARQALGLWGRGSLPPASFPPASSPGPPPVCHVCR